MAAEKPVTLKEVQLRLGVPQHVLIHLCEKGVIEPDFAETSGRGKRREFSQRNLFEFAVALVLRAFEIPVANTALLIRLLRSFARGISKSLPGFAFPDALIDTGLELALHVYDGDQIVLAGRGGPLRRPLILSAKLGERASVVKLDELPRKFLARLEIDLSEIAKRTFNSGCADDRQRLLSERGRSGSSRRRSN
jgi:DNA-binding transcriptional MerR regulator